MQRSRTDLAYQSASAAGATQIGLLKLVYDRLVQDFRSAAEAVRGHNIGARCNASNHALLLLGHLESWDLYSDVPQLAISLAQFYAMLRTRTIQLQHSGAPADFEQLASLVMNTRVAWDRKEAELNERLILNPESDTTPPLYDSGPIPQTRSHWSA